MRSSGRQDHYDIAIIGAGAAGLAGPHRLVAGPLSIIALEARDRIGGRAWTRHLTPDRSADSRMFLAGEGTVLDLIDAKLATEPASPEG